MGRSRLGELQQVNPDAKIAPDTSMLEQDGEFDDFFKVMEDVQKKIDDIRVAVDKIGEKHAQKLSSVSGKQGQVADTELDELDAELRTNANKVKNVIKSLGEDLKKETKKDAGFRLRQQQHAAISRQFFDVMTNYNSIQQKFKQKYRERVVRQYKIVKPDVTEDEIDDALSNEAGDSIFASQILSQGHQEAKKALEEIKDRHEEILKLEKSIRALHQLFVDMALLVEQQGEMLDRIEFNVTNAEDYTADATQQLGSALAFQKSARKKKFICLALVVLLVIILVIILIIILK